MSLGPLYFYFLPIPVDVSWAVTVVTCIYIFFHFILKDITLITDGDGDREMVRDEEENSPGDVYDFSWAVVFPPHF